jgi:nickel/cobalt transporter (NiCoT) family protein
MSSMIIPSSEWVSLCLLAFALGARHGLDADHLAAIDGLSRHNSHSGLARSTGLLFSLGHGVIVLIAAATAWGLSSRWQTPAWLETSGVLVSVAFLYTLGALNLVALFRSDPLAVVAPAGLRARLFSRVAMVRRPWAIAGIGALFAVSFDTISHAALFAIAAGRMGGIIDVLTVAGLFVAGMVLVDGLNGLWIGRLLARADRTAALVSRIMSVTIIVISFTVGTWALARWLVPSLEVQSVLIGPYLGPVIIAAILVMYLGSLLLVARRRGTIVVTDSEG